MDKIERILWLICHAALTVIAVVITVRLCTGCASVKSESAKTNISAVLRLAYENGGKVAVSNRIEQLVVDGKITPEQAAKLHAAAQLAYDNLVDDLAPKAEDGCKDCEPSPECDDGACGEDDANCGNCKDCKADK